MTNRKFSYAKGINGHYEIALSVSNYAAVDKAFETVVQSGAQAMVPTTEEWGPDVQWTSVLMDRSVDQRTCCIADPEGNLIEIGSFTEG